MPLGIVILRLRKPSYEIFFLKYFLRAYLRGNVFKLGINWGTLGARIWKDFHFSELRKVHATGHCDDKASEALLWIIFPLILLSLSLRGNTICWNYLWIFWREFEDLDLPLFYGTGHCDSTALEAFIWRIFMRNLSMPTRQYILLKLCMSWEAPGARI